MAKWNCRLCRTEADSCWVCEDGSMFEKMTNADKIRDMDDEELAEFLANEMELYDLQFATEEKVLKWLKSEVKE